MFREFVAARNANISVNIIRIYYAGSVFVILAAVDFELVSGISGTGSNSGPGVQLPAPVQTKGISVFVVA